MVKGSVRAAILQSSYLPWKGYFDIIRNVDVFVFYDDVQYTRSDWRNRNRFKLSSGLQWLSIPCGSARGRQICEVEIEDARWQGQHWKSILQNYGKCPHFETYRGLFEDLFLNRVWTNLSELNQYAIKTIARDCLGIKTEFRDSRNYKTGGAKTDRLISLLEQLGGVRTYVSGPSAKDYLREEDFDAVGISVEYIDYDHYPEYPQRFPPFRHDVSVLDLLFNVGADAPQYIWGWREKRAEPSEIFS